MNEGAPAGSKLYAKKCWGNRMSCRKGDAVTACRQIDGMNVPVVPAGSPGTVVATSLLGRPKRVEFVIVDEWGSKQFEVEVENGDVKPAV